MGSLSHKPSLTTSVKIWQNGVLLKTKKLSPSGDMTCILQQSYGRLGGKGNVRHRAASDCRHVNSGISWGRLSLVRLRRVGALKSGVPLSRPDLQNART